MPTTWIEVADTAVKIGLGALIAAVGSYLLALRGHRDILARELSSKKIRLLETACEEAEKFFSFTTHLYNLVGAFARNNDESGRMQTDSESTAITKAHKNLLEALEARNKAIANTSLLGATEPLRHINAFSDTLEKFRSVVAYSDIMLTEEELVAFIEEFRSHKREFYASAGVFLNKAGIGN